MNIKVGDAVSIRHYSGLNPFKSIVLKVENDTLTVKLTKDFAVMNFLEGDPVVFGCESENKVLIVGSNIQKIDAAQGTIELVVDKVDSGAEKRRYNRYPVSFYADVRTMDSKKKHLATVKDISYYGMLIYSKVELFIDKEIEMDIYMDRNIVFIKGVVVRKVDKGNCFEYGLRIMFIDYNSMNFMQHYLDKLEEMQTDYVKKLKTDL